MRRVIGMDIHRTFGEVVIWEDGKLRHAGRVDMTRTALEGFGGSQCLMTSGSRSNDMCANWIGWVKTLPPSTRRSPLERFPRFLNR